MKIPFTKMQGLGNDYIYIDVTSRAPEEVRKAVLSKPEAFSLRWSDRHKGVGSDGLVLIGDSPRADFSMRIFNADGSEAKMCGNASRCIGKYVFEKGLTDKTALTLDTLSGIKKLNLSLGKDGKVESVTVDMGKNGPMDPRTGVIGKVGEAFIDGSVEADGRVFRGTAVSVGNPHLVIPVEDAERFDVARYGSILERDPLFPDRTNVEFYSLLPTDSGRPQRVRMRVWERGSGITMACGTGACATAISVIVREISGNSCEVVMDGGSLLISYDTLGGDVRMTGPAAFVFEGVIDTNN